ncbi:type I restriction enzyme, R subunit [Nitrosomonas sp. Nm34]|nr:DEAD/DEAH box helicase family protein [Nitrosomonas sp. Nm34]SFI95267.1 type I restriction enzyme, R subunit [Nitrosomonas sp. Nm34]
MLWQEWLTHKGIHIYGQQHALITQGYYSDSSNKTPRYYHLLAINRTTKAIARGKQRILLVMATGTGKTFTASQIIWRLWKAKARKGILFLADLLWSVTMAHDFKPFGAAISKSRNGR